MSDTQTIVLGGGCFWCTEAVFTMFKGVISVMPGYAGGDVANPTYEQVCSGKTGHAEVLRVEYDLKSVSLEALLEVFFAMHDPTTPNRQGNDIGAQYRSIILYTSEAQSDTIKKFIESIRGEFKTGITTEVKRLDKFYPAEDYHMNYFAKNPLQPYCMLVISPKVKKIKEKYKSMLK